MTAKKKVIYSVIGVVVLAAAGFALMVWRNSKTPPITADCSVGIGVIYYTPQQAFLPSCVKVKSGATITYINQSSDTLAVGTNPHPVHTGDKQVSNGSFTLEVPSGESRQVVLNTTGSFGLHDHNNASSVAVIVVE